MKNSLWRLFLIGDARVLTERKLSYLSNTTYEGLAQFDWSYVGEEMLRYQPLLTDVLLAVSTSRNKFRVMTTLTAFPMNWVFMEF